MFRIKQILVILFLSFNLWSESLLQKANSLYENNEYGKAIKVYHEAIKKGENAALIYFNLANTYYQVDSVAKAIVYYQLSISEAPKFFRPYLNLGILYYNLDNMSSAIAILEQARSLEENNHQLLLLLASAYKIVQEYSVALPLLEQILEEKPKTDECYFLLYEINRIIGDNNEAKFWLERYPEEGKRLADKYQLLAELSEEMGNPTEAVFYYHQLIAIAPQRKWAYYQLVKLIYYNGNILTALQEAEKALYVFNDFGDLGLLAGNIAFENKIYRKAETFYSLAYQTGNAGGLVGLQNLLKLYRAQHESENASRIVNLISTRS